MWRILFALSALLCDATFAGINLRSIPREFFTNMRKSLDQGQRIWVLLAAGSEYWYNYRHQADVCHAYHVLIEHGIPADNIITMMKDDIAYNKRNPFPGKIFNEPHGEDVYSGVKIDYRGDDVTPENFLAILSGQKDGVKGGNGRVIESTEKDNIFVFFSDHGSEGLISFPDDILTAKRLNTVLKAMHVNKRYANLVFYLETCHSGSMFYNMLPENINVYAMTAADPNSSSYACFCGSESMHGLPCLGDCFSYAWIADSARSNPASETLQEQYEVVKKYTTMSEVNQYGQRNITQKKIAEFEGSEVFSSPTYMQKRGKALLFSKVQWPSRDVPLLHVEHRLKTLEEMNGSPQQWIETATELRNMRAKRRFVDGFMEFFVKDLIHDPKLARKILTNRATTITNFDCHDTVVKQFFDRCFHCSKDSYALSKVYMLVNMCENGIDEERIIDHMKLMCSLNSVRNIV